MLQIFEHVRADGRVYRPVGEDYLPNRVATKEEIWQELDRLGKLSASNERAIGETFRPLLCLLGAR